MRLLQLFDSICSDRFSFYYQAGFDPDIRAFIEANRFPIDQIDCDAETARWARKLKRAGFGVEIHLGCYVDQREEAHHWLVVEGKIFDPTAEQFSGPIRAANYRTDGVLPV